MSKGGASRSRPGAHLVPLLHCTICQLPTGFLSEILLLPSSLVGLVEISAGSFPCARMFGKPLASKGWVHSGLPFCCSTKLNPRPWETYVLIIYLGREGAQLSAHLLHKGLSQSAWSETPDPHRSYLPVTEQSPGKPENRLG